MVRDQNAQPPIRCAAVGANEAHFFIEYLPRFSNMSEIDTSQRIEMPMACRVHRTHDGLVKSPGLLGSTVAALVLPERCGKREPIGNRYVLFMFSAILANFWTVSLRFFNKRLIALVSSVRSNAE
jgi:hypothetical protein